MDSQYENPGFLLKSALGCSFIATVILLPFGINSFFQDNYILGIINLTLTSLCGFNAWLCSKGHYSNRFSLYVLAPMIIIGVAYALFKLETAGSYWPFMGILAMYFILPKNYAWKFNAVFLAIILPSAWMVLEPSLATRFTAASFGTSFFAFISLSEIHKLHAIQRRQAVTDSLTGLYNRTLLQSYLEQTISQYKRHKDPTSIMMIDVDYFKKINDEFGHHVGDSVLIEMGRFLNDYFRDSDMVFRIGGEEFLAIVHNTNQADCLALADKLRLEMQQLTLVPNRQVTASIGVASLQANMDWKDWMKHCDDKLYQAKSNGRNQVAA